jgi:hypothetical protein
MDNTDESGPGNGWPRREVTRRREKPIWGKLRIEELRWTIGGEERCTGRVTT